MDMNKKDIYYRILLGSVPRKEGENSVIRQGKKLGFMQCMEIPGAGLTHQSCIQAQSKLKQGSGS